MNQKIIQEKRQNILIGLLISIIMFGLMYWFMTIFAEPIIRDGFRQLILKDFLLFSSMTLMFLFMLIFSIVYFVFNIYKLIFPTKLILSPEGLFYITHKKIYLNWKDIESINYWIFQDKIKFNFKKIMKRILSISLTNPIAFIRVIQLYFIVDSQNIEKWFYIYNKDKTKILVMIDAGFCECKNILEIIKNYQKEYAK